jgi:glutamate-1-semialdehyde 2,1-aminomutase
MQGKARNAELTEKFDEYYPGGHSNLRRLPIEASAGSKVFVSRAKGAHLWDVDGNEYVEFAGALGPTILGYCDDEYVESLKECLSTLPTVCGSGLMYGEDDVLVAEMLRRHVPCAEQLKFSVTGSEAVQMAFRMARAYTGKPKILRFVEHYHGWFDNVLGGVIERGANGDFKLDDDPDDEHYTQGLAPDAKRDTIVIPWNDFDALRSAFERHGGEIAIIHFEAMVNNCFGMFPKPGFLELIRELCDKHRVVMSVDEVITGMRLGLGGAQAFFGITPDICTMGKAVSAGLPVALIAGKKELMSHCLATRRVLGPGTFNGWNLGMRAIAKTIEILERDNGARYNRMLKVQERFTEGVLEAAQRRGVPVRITEAPGVFHSIFGIEGGRAPVYTMDELAALDMDRLNKLKRALFLEGLVVIPGFRWYMNLSHTDADVDFALEKLDKTLARY